MPDHNNQLPELIEAVQLYFQKFFWRQLVRVAPARQNNCASSFDMIDAQWSIDCQAANNAQRNRIG